MWFWFAHLNDLNENNDLIMKFLEVNAVWLFDKWRIKLAFKATIARISSRAFIFWQINAGKSYSWLYFLISKWISVRPMICMVQLDLWKFIMNDTSDGVCRAPMLDHESVCLRYFCSFAGFSVCRKTCIAYESRSKVTHKSVTVVYANGAVCAFPLALVPLWFRKWMVFGRC